MIKKFIFLLSAVIGLLLTCYFFQPMKVGKGYDALTKYERVNGWPDLPENLNLGNPVGLSLDSDQHVVLFHRAEREWPLLKAMPDSFIKSSTILVIDRDSGKLLKSWGENLFIMPHGLTVDNENNVWVTDVGLHQVFKFNADGKMLLKLGEAKVSGNDSVHFDRPTDIAIAGDGSIYVSDGYGNSRIVKFSPEGKYLSEWGQNGDKEGEFNVPHGITIDKSGNVYVADRENSRIQVFDPNGRFLKQFLGDSFGAMCSVSFDKATSNLYAIDDLSFLKVKHRGSDVFVIDTLGKIKTRFGRSGSYEGATCWYHDLAIDKDQNIYVGDILGNTLQKFRKVPAN